MDKLIKKIIEKQNPSVMGLDTKLAYIPQQLRDTFGEDCADFASCARAILQYNKMLIDAVYDIVPGVKLQAAYYEMYSHEGMQAFRQTAAYAKEKGLYVIADVKRNDIGATAEAYASAYLGTTVLQNTEDCAFDMDSVTLNAYLGSDGIKPFLDICAQIDKTAFILVKTSNKSSGELQDMLLSDGRKIYEAMGDMVAQWGEASIGRYGYSSAGAVVGATYPQQGRELRERLAHTFFLIPGYGAQGGAAEDLAGCFDSRGLGGVVNASRSLICAYQKECYSGMTPAEAARTEAIRMRDDIVGTLKKLNKWSL